MVGGAYIDIVDIGPGKTNPFADKLPLKNNQRDIIGKLQVGRRIFK